MNHKQHGCNHRETFMAGVLRGTITAGFYQARRHSTPQLAFSCPFGYEKTRSMNCVFQKYLCRERCSAAAAAGRVWVLERKARAHHIRGVIYLNAIQILRRKHIDE